MDGVCDNDWVLYLR